MNRLTLSDIAHAVIAKASKRMSTEQFAPIPCSHPNCGWISLFARRFGLTLNIMGHIDLPRAMSQAAYKTVLSTPEIREIVGADETVGRRIAASIGRRLIRARDVVGIAIKPFMDRFNYDQDRVSACCHHLMDTHGNAVSFCEYNARLRPHDSWEPFPELDS